MAVSDAQKKRETVHLKMRCRHCETIRKYEDCEPGCTLIEKRKDKK